MIELRSFKKMMRGDRHNRCLGNERNEDHVTSSAGREGPTADGPHQAGLTIPSGRVKHTRYLLN